MKRTILLTALSLLLGGASCFAQNTLNVHQKDGAIVSYAFSEQPLVTYTDEGIHLVTTKVEVDYPMANLEKFTFSDDPNGINEIRTAGATSDIRIYALNGKLLKTVRQQEGAATFSTDELPQGVYIIKNGETTYKVTKK